MYANNLKPAFDRVTAALMLLTLSPVLIIGIVIAAISCKGNPIFRHERPGLHTKSIYVLKLKTMKPGIDAQGRVLTNIERITPMGHFLRRSSIDEIPQLFNVLIGDLSLVGPRPLQVWYLPHYTARQNLRHSVKPGITGLAQVNGRNKLNWEDRLELDVVYASNISFSLDIKILLKTLVKVFKISEINAREGNTMDGFVERPSSSIDKH